MRQSACGTDRGIRREINEDAMLCMDAQNFYMLADGVGGHNSGEIASKLAVDTAKEYILQNPPCCLMEKELEGYFNDFMQKINREIYLCAMESKTTMGMATTAIMLLLRDENAYVINIGDSRAYLMRDGSLERITEDHTYVNELLKKGEITQTEAMDHPKRHVITRALGIEKTVEADFYKITTIEKDRILLCTDGLYNEVDENDIKRIVAGEPDLTILVNTLIKMACDNGGKDNITVNCIEI